MGNRWKEGGTNSRTDFTAQSVETDDEHGRSAHALHGLVAKHISTSLVPTRQRLFWRERVQLP
jgi:hypothetical protein